MLIHGGAIVDPEAGSPALGDILVRDGVVAAIGAIEEREADAADERIAG